MDTPEKKKTPPSPPRDGYYPPTTGPVTTGPTTKYPTGPPAAVLNNNPTGTSDAPPETYYRPYGPETNQPAPPSMVDLPPRPTQSTVGSAVGGYLSQMQAQPNGIPSNSYGGLPPPPPHPPHPPHPPSPGLNTMVSANDTMTKTDLSAARAAAVSGLEVLITLQWQQKQHLQYGAGAAQVPNSTAAAVAEQVGVQTGAVLRDVRFARRAVALLEEQAERHRFRRWLVSGLVAGFVPLVRRLFRRPRSTEKRVAFANGTEYAFVRSRSLVDRMLGSLQRRRGLVSMAFFVFAVLYIFTNEVTLRVARTLSRRLKRLGTKIERGTEDLTAMDLKVLSGWRWRVLLWGR